MSWKIQVYRAKPNPQGKDRLRYGAPDAQQLLAEWVDLKNIGDEAVRMSTLHLAHRQFDKSGNMMAQPSIYWTGSSSELLLPGKIVRVHTGKSSTAYLMRQEDRLGVDHHEFAENGNFVLNNKEGDHISVWWKTSEGKWNIDDQASYDPNPREGAILIRVGQKLIAASI